jgi:hypothetical protein
MNDDMEVQGHMEILVLDKTIVVDPDDLQLIGLLDRTHYSLLWI